MEGQQERRTDRVQRIEVCALVEVCGTDGDVPAFEAESSNLSGHGIRIRTAYLPEPGATVVCRFDSGGREVLAEGVVAWSHEEARGGEFGVRFTALDAESAQALADLCGREPAGEPDSGDAHHSSEAVTAGTKVKLHIEGLGAPMRARVQQSTANSIYVGSSLEFLRIGKRLELESMPDGTRREARIEGLDVLVDPSTGVPRLVVLLQAQGAEDTPEPSVVDLCRSPAAHQPAALTAAGTVDSPVDESSAPKSKLLEDRETESPEGLEQTVAQMQGAARRAGQGLVRAGAQVTRRLTPALSRMIVAVARAGRKNSPSIDPPRRRTASPVPGGFGQKSIHLRPQGPPSPDAVAPEPASPAKPDRRRKWLIRGGAAAAAGLVAGAVALVLPGAATDHVQAPRSIASASAQSAPIAASPAAVPGANQATHAGQVVANVPLFGPTPMATLEPAPLNSALAPEGPDAVAAREMALAKSVAAAIAPGSTDTNSPTTTKASTARPEDIAPWGRGTMKNPLIYTIRLDGPGTVLEGTALRDGFKVTVPGCKTLESPRGFARRDSRFAEVDAINDSHGVKFVWKFDGDVPGYRVRLRDSTIQFLINASGKR